MRAGWDNYAVLCLSSGRDQQTTETIGLQEQEDMSFLLVSTGILGLALFITAAPAHWSGLGVSR